MKIKRFDNLWTMGMIISAIILLVVYACKVFFPDFLIGVAEIEPIVNVGKYIDTHKWAWYIASAILSFLSYYFICCACCKKKWLNTKEILIILGTILLLFIVQEFLPKQYTVANLCSTLILPLIFNADFKATTIVFCIVNVLQTFTLEIRNLETHISVFNFASLIILMIDIYIIEVLLYLIFNYEKEGK